MKRRYQTANQIRDDIDRFKRKAQKLMDSAAQLDKLADLMIENNPLDVNPEDIIYHREQAKKKRQSALRIEQRKLVHLKNKLAEFNTEILPGIGINDRSIQA